MCDFNVVVPSILALAYILTTRISSPFHTHPFEGPADLIQESLRCYDVDKPERPKRGLGPSSIRSITEKLEKERPSEGRCIESCARRMNRMMSSC